MTQRRLSPIEMMIDQATGHRPGRRPPQAWVTLRCPRCKRTKQVYAHETDPPNTRFIEAPCDKCDRGGDKPETNYFDAQDRQLHPETGELLSR
jgi:ribosomal protein S27E